MLDLVRPSARRGRAQVVCAALAVTLLAGTLAMAAGAASAPIISTFAGGLGQGAKLSVGQTPAAVAVGPDATVANAVVPNGIVYVADTTFNVVRAIRVSTGQETVVAGTGAIGYSGDGGPATAATLGLRTIDGTTDPPPGLAVDTSGNLYFSDTFNHVVRKLNTSSGIITTVVGTGSAGFAGDGGPAALAQLNRPSGLAFDGAGNLDIADSGNHRVRQLVVAFGAITTVAGSSATGGFSGDGAQATAAQLSTPTGVDFDSLGNLFIADKGNCRVRKVSSPPGGVITTFAGSAAGCGYDGDGAAATTQMLKDPYDVAVDPSANVYIADRGNCLVRKVGTGTSAIISTVAGVAPPAAGTCGYNPEGSPATARKLNLPFGVALLGAELLVADTTNGRVRKLTFADSTISTYAGNGTPRYSGDGAAAADAQLYGPAGMARAADGTVYVADSENQVVRKIAADGAITTVAGDGSRIPGFSGDGGPATAAKLNFPRGVAVDTAGNLYIADEGNCVIRKVAVAAAGVTAGTISTVVGTAPSPSPNCGSSTPADLIAATLAKLNHPYGVAVAASGDLYVADTDSHVIRVVSGGVINRFAGTTGTSGNTGDGASAMSATLNTPRSVAVAADGTVYIADTLNNRVRKVSSGTIAAFAGTGDFGFSGDEGSAIGAKLALPYAVSVGADGVFIADTFNDRIRRVTAGTIATVAGSGARGFSGDGGAPTSARLDRPTGVVAGEAGVFHIGDRFNDRIRRVGPPPPTKPSAPLGVSGVPGNGQVTVSWSAPADDGGAAISGYEVTTKRASEVVKTVSVAGTELTALVTDLANGTSYTFTVKASNAVGASPASAPSAAVTPRTVPGAPTGVVASAGNAQVTVSWTAPTDDGRAPITSYVVSARQGDAVVKTASAAGTERSVTVAGLTNGTAYTFTATAVNDAGPGPASAASAAVSPSAPVSPPTTVAPTTPVAGQPPSAGQGYTLVGEDGRVYNFGTTFAGDLRGERLNAPVIGLANTASGNGYWLVAKDGGIFTFGDAGFFGSTGNLKLNAPILGMEPTPTGLGYWLFAADGGIFTFGDAGFFGSTGDLRLNAPMIGMETTGSGQGYWLVAQDGGIFTFGDAPFHGSTGSLKLNQPVFDLAALADGSGYWLVARDGGIFTFGPGAAFYDSAVGKTSGTTVGIGDTPSGAGYWIADTNGRVFNFGDAQNLGDLQIERPSAPIVGFAALK